MVVGQKHRECYAKQSMRLIAYLRFLIIFRGIVVLWLSLLYASTQQRQSLGLNPVPVSVVSTVNKAIC